MEFDGTIEKNVISALRSAKRLRGRSVHADTIEHWKCILERAQSDLACDSSSDHETMRQLVSDLEAELASRMSDRPR